VDVKVSRNKRFTVQNKGDGNVVKIEVVAGSKEEKISVSIKT